jgi:hypothetical protein
VSYVFQKWIPAWGLLDLDNCGANPNGSFSGDNFCPNLGPDYMRHNGTVKSPIC